MRGGIKGDLMRRKKEERIRKKEKGRNEEGGDIMEEVKYGSERGCRTEKEAKKQRRREGREGGREGRREGGKKGGREEGRISLTDGGHDSWRMFQQNII